MRTDVGLQYALLRRFLRTPIIAVCVLALRWRSRGVVVALREVTQ